MRATPLTVIFEMLAAAVFLGLHAGVHEFEWGNSTGHGAPVYTDDQGHGYNVLRSVSPEPADRYYGGAWHFDPSGFANQNGYHDPLPQL